MNYPESRRVLSVVKVASSVFQLISEKRLLLVRNLTGYVVVLTVTSICESYFDQGDDSVLAWSYSTIHGAVFVFFAVACHRVLLLDRDSFEQDRMFRFTGRELRFLGWSFVAYFYLLFVAMALMIPMSIIFEYIEGSTLILAIYISLLPGMYLFARLALLLPSTAVDQRNDINWAWGLSRGNGWRLVVLVGLIPQVFTLGETYLYGYGMLSDLLVTLMGCVFAVVEIALLSQSFRFLSGFGQESEL
ncbi:MAG: hypothetical protein P8101_07730 [Candidatus Thiodiazotropha sp.]